jgi:predicted phosphoribosyltransferase/dienelactone hydrolase
MNMFADRREAGRALATRLGCLAEEDIVVLGLPRGGVPVAAEAAAALGAPLDVIVVRKLGVPFQPELAMGAIGEDGARVLNDEVVRLAHITRAELAAVEKRERAELERRASRFRAARPRIDLNGRTALIVDDGIATGSTARAACQVARAHGATRVVLAAPVAPPDVARRFEGDVDELVVYATPEPFYGVGQFYADFSQTSDEEVIDLLTTAARAQAPTSRPKAAGDDPPLRSEEVQIAAGPVALDGFLHVPEEPSGVVVFAHGSGSSRHSSRNRYVASMLNEAGIATLLFDLLTPREELDRANIFDVELLAGRLGAVTAWARAQPEVKGLPVGYFGASTGAAAALCAAAEPHAEVAAVVSRGGRPDLAGNRLGSVRAPTRLIVGGEDTVVLQLNREAQARLSCESDLQIVPGATHLFEEPETLRRAAELARDWFAGHFAHTTAATTSPP